MRALIAGCGGYLPPLRLSNDELAARYGLETSDAWIQERTGIKYRHVAAPDEAASDLAAAAGGRDLGQALAADHKAAGVDCRIWLGGGFVHWHRFARQQRFVDPDAVGANQHRIGRNTIALAQLEQVSTHHVAPGNPLGLSVAYDQRAWACEVAQRFDGVLCLALLVQGETQGDDHEPKECQTLLKVTESEVQGSRSEGTSARAGSSQRSPARNGAVRPAAHWGHLRPGARRPGLRTGPIRGRPRVRTPQSGVPGRQQPDQLGW